MTTRIFYNIQSESFFKNYKYLWRPSRVGDYVTYDRLRHVWLTPTSICGGGRKRSAEITWVFTEWFIGTTLTHDFATTPTVGVVKNSLWRLTENYPDSQSHV